MDNLFYIWITAMVVALSLDVSAYIVLRRQWKKRGFTIIDELSERMSNRLGQIKKRWQELRPVKTKLAPVQQPVQEEEQMIQADLQPELIAASVKTIGRLQRVQFSMDVPLDSRINISISSTPETGVKVEKTTG